MYATETPILESVFVSMAPDAVDIADVYACGTDYWITAPLTYAELLDWTSEQADISEQAHLAELRASEEYRVSCFYPSN